MIQRFVKFSLVVGAVVAILALASTAHAAGKDESCTCNGSTIIIPTPVCEAPVVEAAPQKTLRLCTRNRYTGNLRCSNKYIVPTDSFYPLP